MKNNIVQSEQTSIAGYNVLEKLYEGDRSILYRALRISDNQPVVLKKLQNELPAPEEVTRFFAEFEMTRGLSDDGVIRAYGLEKCRRTLVMVLEDFRGTSLADHIAEHRLDLKEALSLIIRITVILGRIHQQNIVHKDINPSNIIWNPENGGLKIIDFGVSTLRAGEGEQLVNQNLIEGTLGYISPEQTGRINRCVDHRSDLYSIGVMCYEIFTGQRPFKEGEALEIVYSHIARPPEPPHTVAPHIPETLSRIILKLMAKTPEDRYQTAYGLSHDLRRCLDGLTNPAAALPFELGKKDISSRFAVSQRLQGREKERRILREAFARARLGGCEMVLVSGDSGTGKSALVKGVSAIVAQGRGAFISGKFDPHKHSPYEPLINVFQELVRSILAGHNASIKGWRERISGALGVNGKVLADVIPEVELIIGKQPDVPELPPTESQNRFIGVFRNFVSTFATSDHALVLFLDDLQWADSSSLSLIESIVSDQDMIHIMVIGAFRNEEAGDTHPLEVTLRGLAKKQIPVQRVHLSPLGFAEVVELVMDTLKREPDELKLLAELCLKKTGGNPFFLNQFLTQLHKDGQIVFHEASGQWEWDLGQIRAAEIPQTVADLVVGRIEELSGEAIQILRVAACLGGRFEFKILTCISALSMKTTAAAVWETLQAGLVIPTDDSYRFVMPGNFEKGILDIDYTPPDVGFAFLHDRVHQAVYALVLEENKKEIHLEIGRLMLKRESGEISESLLFNSVNHLNKGSDLINNRDELEYLAELNLKAGKKAKESAAFQVAFEFFSTGMKLLDSTCWNTRYALILELHIEVAEAAYLTGNFHLMEETSRQILGRAKTILDTIEIYNVKIRAAIAQNNPILSVRIAIEALNRLGVSFPKNPGKRHVVIELIKTRRRLLRYSAEDLINLPEMTNPEKNAAMGIMVNVIRSAYYAAPELSTLLAFRCIRFTLKYGLSFRSAAGFSVYGLIQCGITGDIDSGYVFGKLALDIAGRFNDRLAENSITFVYNLFIRHWKEPLKNTLKPLLETYTACLENGRIDDAANAAQSYCSYLYLSGAPLGEVEGEMARFGGRIEALKQKTILYQLKMLHQSVLNCMGKSEHTTQLAGSVYDEVEMLPAHLEAGDNTSLFLFYVVKMELCYLFGHNSRALAHANAAIPYSKGAVGIAAVKRFYTFDSLIRLALYESSSKPEKMKILIKVVRNQKKIRHWSRFCPENMLDRYYLVEAELCRVRKRDTRASRYYKKAIEWAKKQEHFYAEALPNERCALFWMNRGERETATLYLNNASHLYRLWGAHAKVDTLEKLYPDVELVTCTHPFTEDAATPCQYAESLDLSSVIKASQAISREIELDRLLDTLMKIMAENAGAQKGFLILNSGIGQKQNLTIGADFGVEHQFTGNLDSCVEMALSIVRYVERTGNPVVLRHGAREGLFVRDEYIEQHRVKSVLCIPIRHQGVLTALLYLENNDTPGVFTPERVNVLQMLTTQAAISINNARLYTTYRSLYDHAVEGIFQATINGGVISANPAMAVILGYDSSEDLFSLNINISDLFASTDDRNTLLRMLRENNRVVAFDTRFIKKNGERVWVSVSVRAVIDVNQQAGHFEGAVIDISERKKKEKALREREAAESANRVKSRFLAMMSHEIRTPINAIIGMTSLTLEKDLEPKVEENLTIVRSSARSLLGLVDDVLDYSKIEADKLEMETVPFEIMSVFKKIFHMFALPASEKGLEINIRVGDDVPLLLNGDPGRLAQVLINLTGNAVKFTDHGHIDICVNLLSVDINRIRLEFVVKDTGVGIQEGFTHLLFTPFTQADSSISRKYGGTGLGLAISKELVEMMNGQIRVESHMENGATFFFTADFGSVSEEQGAMDKVTRHLSTRNQISVEAKTKTRRRLTDRYCSLRGAHVLVVEDNLINRKIIVDILESIGVSSDIAGDGVEAIEALQKKQYDGLLMDIQMPVMDGFAAVEKIRDDLKLKDLPVIAMTAGGLKGDREKCQASGMNDYILKPFEPHTLCGVLETWITHEKSGFKTGHGRNVINDSCGDVEIPLNLPAMDASACLKRLRGNKRLFFDLMRDFEMHHMHDIVLFKDAVTRGDIKRAGRIIHTLKGVAAGLSAAELKTILEQIEKSQDDHFKGIDTFIEKAQTEVTRILQSCSMFSGNKADFQGAEESVEKLLPETALEKLKPILNNLSESLRRFDPVETEELLCALTKHLEGSPWVTNLARRIDRLDFEQAYDDLQSIMERHEKRGNP